MHEPVIQNLEEILRGAAPGRDAEDHLKGCEACREIVASMKMQNEMFRALQPARDVETRPGFYARVMERIESQARPSIWSTFGESLFAKRLAYASFSFVVLLGTYVLSSARSDQQVTVNGPEAILADDTQAQVGTNNPERDRETILVTLATYQE